VSVGGRYTRDKRTSQVLRTTFLGGFSNLFGGAGIPIAVTSNFNGSATFKDFNPRASISYQPNRNHNLYLTYSQGFKGGGFDPRGQTTACRNSNAAGLHSADELFDFMSFEPETVDSYEAGLEGLAARQPGEHPPRRLPRTVHNVQIPGSVGFDSNGDGINDSFIGITSNAASADINGVEFEGTALVGKDFAGAGSRLRSTGRLAILMRKFNTFIDAFGQDVASQRVFQNTPDLTAHMGFNLGVPVAKGHDGLHRPCLAAFGCEPVRSAQPVP
jgi:iron complex outermembrane recepter protein